MMMEGEPKGPHKRIQQIRLKFKFNSDYAPFKHFNPYQLREELNKAVRGLYDIEFVHVRYIMSTLPIYLSQEQDPERTQLASPRHQGL